MVTEKEIRAYFANPNQSNNEGWTSIRSLAIKYLKKQGFKTSQICEIVGVGRKCVWEHLTKRQPKTTINFEKAIKQKLYPKVDLKTSYIFE